MLIVEEEKMNAVDFCNLFSIPLNKIKKQPSFELNASKVFKDTANGNVVKVNKGVNMRSHFFAMHPVKKYKVEIRYCTSIQQKPVGDKRIPVYHPRYVGYQGQKFSFQNDLDLGIYMYLHPRNKFSPLRDPKQKGEFDYEFIDPSARAMDAMTNLDSLADALSHAKNSPIDKLVIMAKGLGINNVDSKVSDGADVLRVEMMKYASNPKTTKKYVDAMTNNVILVEGRISNLIDLKGLEMGKNGHVRQWYWGKGEREGEPVGAPIINVNQDARKAIKTFLLSNLHLYNEVISSYTNGMAAYKKAEEYLKSQEPEEDTESIGDDLPDYLKDQEPSVNPSAPADDMKEGLPTTFQECLDTIAEMGYSKKRDKVKIVMNGISEGKVTKENFSHFVKTLWNQPKD